MAPKSEKVPASVLPGLTSGLELLYPDRAVEPSPWLGHTPFALWLIEATKPRMVVELGVHTGNSYCAFVEAVHKLSLDTRCFGIDHWKGDEHAGLYGEEVFEQLRDYHDTRYGSFSTLLRSSFDEALPYFTDGSIDLLHIDGLHTYEAVSKDFESWLPKLSTRGIVLFHDINVRERKFGIWRFWDEITSKYPHFEFIHSHGLGIAYVGSQPLTGAISDFFAIKTDELNERIHRYFARLGTSIVDSLEKQTVGALVDKLEAQVIALEAELKKARSEITTANAEVKRVNELQAKLEASTLQLSKAKAEAETRVKDIEAKLQTSTRQLSEARAEAERRVKDIEAKLQVSTRQLSEARAEAETRVKDIEAKLRISTLQLSEAETTAKDMKAKLHASTLQLSEAQTNAKDMEAQLQKSSLKFNHATAEAKTRVKDLEAEFRAVTSHLSKANAHTKDLEIKLQASRLQTQIKTAVAHQRIAATARLQRELFAESCEKRTYQRQLQDILQSSSWRVTGPVRSVVRWLKRLLATDGAY